MVFLLTALITFVGNAKQVPQLYEQPWLLWVECCLFSTGNDGHVRAAVLKTGVPTPATARNH